MTIPVHDTILYGYSVNAQNNDHYTIRLYTAFYHSTPTEYTDVIFTGVVAHYFESENAFSVIFDIEEDSVEAIYRSSQALFERLKNYGWPFLYDTEEELLTRLKAQSIKAFTLHSSAGIEGWIWAQTIHTMSRSAQKVFDD